MPYNLMCLNLPRFQYFRVLFIFAMFTKIGLDIYVYVLWVLALVVTLDSTCEKV